MGSTHYINRFGLNLKFNVLDLLFSVELLERELDTSLKVFYK